MKIQIFHLEKHDDFITVRDKLNWVKTTRVVLVLPQKTSILARKLDLVLLQRTCTRNGSQLGLVTGDPQVGLHAEQLGIPVFSTIKEAQRSRWRFRRARLYIRRRLESPPDLKTMRQNLAALPVDWAEHPRLRWARLGIFTLGVLAVVILGVAFIPSATILLEATHQEQRIQMVVQASPEIKLPSFAGVLPLHYISAIVEGDGEEPVNGTASIPDQYARGEVVFTNLVEDAVDIPVGTLVISTSNLQELEVIEAGDVDAGAGSTTRLPVRAVVAGITGNLPSRSIDAIKGTMGLRLAVTNLSPITGGTNKQVQTATQPDVDALRLKILNRLKQEALTSLQGQLSIADHLVPDSLVEIRIIEEIVQPLPGEPAEFITMRLSVEFSASYIAGSELLAYAENVMDARLPPHHLVVPGTLLISPAAQPEISRDGVLAWKFTALRQIKPFYDAQNVSILVQGTTRRNAQKRLVQIYALENEPVILLNPLWWPRLPIFPFRIEISQGEGV
jgi:hypothetical protein